jgi:hypothetical protein
LPSAMVLSAGWDKATHAGSWWSQSVLLWA